MRDLGAEYDALMEGKIAPSLWRVYAAHHGISGQPDPFDLTPYVTGVAVSRPGRGKPNSGTIVLDNGEGDFDAGSGGLAGIVARNNAEIRVEMGTRLAAGEQYWRVMTGGVIESGTPYNAAGSKVTVTLGDRGRNLARANITSDLFEGTQANNIIKALFQHGAGFTDPADFNLPALDHPIRTAQFETEPLMTAAGACVQPVGRVLKFDYDGRLSHELVTPAGYTPMLTVRKIAVESLDVKAGPPSGTRVMVAGGPDRNRPTVGQAEIIGESRYAWDHPGGNNVLGPGDCYEYELTNLPRAAEWYYAAHYWFHGPKGRHYREAQCYLDDFFFSASTMGIAFGGGTEPYVVDSVYNEELDVMVIHCWWDTAEKDWLWVDFSFAVYGYPVVWFAPKIDVQVWDDSLISSFGDIPHTVQAPLVGTYSEAELVGANDLAFLKGGQVSIRATLRELDLRIEPNDVITIENELGDDVICWVQSVKHGAGSNAQTVINGIGVP